MNSPTSHQRRNLGFLSIFVFFLFPAKLILAQELDDKVKALFEAKCQECHHPDTSDDFPYLHKDVTLADLISDEVVVPGKPDDSSIYTKVILEADSRKRMPKSRGEKGDDSYRDPLTKEEQDLIKDWIAGAKEVTPPTFTKTEVRQEEDEPEIVISEEQIAKVVSDTNELPSGIKLEEKVRFIFQENCVTCHGKGDKEPELHGSTSLSALFAVKDGAGRNMVERIIELTHRPADDDERMPESYGEEGSKNYRPPLTEEEKEVLRKWADSGRTIVEGRDTISNNDMIDAIHDDLREASEAERKFFRYLTLTNLYNAKNEDGTALVSDLDSHRAAISKLINSLSSHGKITRPTPIDEEETIYRIDLRDYNWDKHNWDEVIQYYPYGILGIDRQKENRIKEYTGSKMAYVRADWFNFAASQPPLYDDLLYDIMGMDVDKDGDVLKALEDAIGVDRIDNLQEGNAMRAGFLLSGVSEANRLIERHEIGTHKGSYWVSYDFTPLNPERAQELLHAPLGPPDAHLTKNPDHVFHHDGGEMIWSLPNGLQGYMLTTADGKRLDRGPTEIVHDKSRPDSVIINGISCMSCHRNGIKPAEQVQNVKHQSLDMMTDEIKPAVLDFGILDFEETNLLEKLYADPEDLRAAVVEDATRYKNAEILAVGELKGATEPVRGLYDQFTALITAHRLASELGIEHDELLEVLEEESDRSKTLRIISSSLSRGLVVERATLLREYISVVYALGYELMPFTPLGYEDFGGQKYADNIAQSDAYLAAFGSSDYSFEESKEKVLSDKGAAETLAQESVLLHDGGKLRLSIQPELHVGERAKLNIVATADIHIRVFHFSSDEFVTELYPGDTGGSSFRPKNKKLEVSWETTKPGGPEQVIVFAASSEITNIAKGEKVGDFVLYDKEKIFSTRGIPTGIRVAEIKEEKSAVPAQITRAKIGYLLKE